MKTVVITGSTRGIGRGLAESFLKLGCRVVISGRSQGAVDAAVVELSVLGPVSGCACEITDAQQLQALWDHAAGQTGQVDVWINNAGMSIAKKTLDQQSVEDVEAIAATNLTGLLLACRTAIIGMRQQGLGQIWNMEGFGSNGAAQSGMACYGATKRAVNYLNKALQKDVAGSGVQICTLSPGIVVTDLLIGDYDTGSPEWQKSKRIFNILGDKVETVTPWLASKVLAANASGSKVAWLTNGKAFWRFLTAAFNKRDLFAEHGV
ncbi:MAG: SDR family NAD(P)-dependent oxidoreductase [Spongiibacteraceae bacterium]